MALSLPTLMGCDDAAQHLFHTRYPPVASFLHDQVQLGADWGDLYPPSTRALFQARFTAFEQDGIQSRLGHRERETAAHLQYRQQYLLPLAEALALPAVVQTRILHRCVKQGLFDHPTTRHRIRPDPAAVLSQVLSVYDPTATVKRQASHFQQVGLCQGELQARAAARALHSAEKQSANDARAIVLAALAHGWVGLVTHAAYGVAPALCLLQTHVAALMAHLTTPLPLLAVVRVM